MSDALIPVSSTWLVVDGLVHREGTKLKLPPGRGDALGAARAEIRRRIAERRR